jgi:hypothetical protein
MARRYPVGGDDEFSDRENLGELPNEDDNNLPASVQRPTLPPSRKPPGTPPSSPGGIPYGRFFQKRYREDFGQPSAPTGGIKAPVQFRHPADPTPVYDEEHPLPAQLPRECWDYFFNLLRQMLVKVEKPTWIEPPSRAKPIDEFSSGLGVPLVPLGVPVAITTEFVIPEGSLGFITRVGVSIDTLTEWGKVHFHLRKNGVDVDKYGDFTMQIGSPEEPQLLAAPLDLRPRDRIQIFANTTGLNPVSAFGRAFGWHFPAQVLTSDGSFRERIVD